jgi:hypothetical protein
MPTVNSSCNNLWMPTVNSSCNKFWILNVDNRAVIWFCSVTLHIMAALQIKLRGRWGRDRMVVGFTTTYVMGKVGPWSYGSWSYNYLCNRCLSPLMLWVRLLLRARCTTLCDKVCQWLSPGTPISPTNRIDCHDRTEILLKVALNTIKPNNQIKLHSPCVYFFSGGDMTICKCDWVIGGFWRSIINNDRVRYYCCHSVAKING